MNYIKESQKIESSRIKEGAKITFIDTDFPGIECNGIIKKIGTGKDAGYLLVQPVNPKREEMIIRISRIIRIDGKYF
jgi:hypothetical protein